MKSFISFAWSVAFISLVFYGFYHFWGDSAGLSALDCIIGLLSIIWLLFIVTVPWNAYFKAKEILNEAAISKRKDIIIIEENLDYVKRVIKTALTVSIALHIISALVLYYIARSGISITGYYAAIVTLLFTFLRPAIRFYEYLQHKLNTIRQEFRYPREDINTLLEDITQIKQDIQFILAELSTKKGDDSWRNSLDNYCQHNDKLLNDIQHKLSAQQSQLENEVQKLTDSHNSLVTRMVDNAQVLESIKVIGRFFKGL
jgi:hypothetical protein